MSAAVPRRAFGAALALVGTGLAGWGLAKGEDGFVVAALLAASSGAFLVLCARRRLALLAVGLGLAAGLGVAMALHHALRGEHRAAGPAPRPLPPPDAGRLPPADVRPRGAPTRLLVWGDCRGGMTVLARLLCEVERRRPDMTIGLGDLVGMARTYQFQILADKLAATGVPAFTVPGNHDLDPFGTLGPYTKVFGAPSWSFAWRGVLYLGLDSSRGVLDPGDVDRLEGLVRARRASVAHVLLFLHHPLYEPDEHPEKPLPEDDASRRLRALVEREGIQVFASHYHGFDVQQHGRTRQVTTGGAGARPESDEAYHYVWVEIGDDVTVTRVDLARQDEVSPAWDRLLVFRDEASYAAGDRPVPVLTVLLALTTVIGGLGAALAPGRGARSGAAD